MRQAGPILSLESTLLFFLCPYRHSSASGTLVIVMQSQLHVIHAVFFRRDIVIAGRNSNGVCSLGFGPEQPVSNRAPGDGSMRTSPLPRAPLTGMPVAGQNGLLTSKEASHHEKGAFAERDPVAQSPVHHSRPNESSVDRSLPESRGCATCQRPAIMDRGDVSGDLPYSEKGGGRALSRIPTFPVNAAAVLRNFQDGRAQPKTYDDNHRLSGAVVMGPSQSHQHNTGYGNINGSFNYRASISPYCCHGARLGIYPMSSSKHTTQPKSPLKREARPAEGHWQNSPNSSISTCQSMRISMLISEEEEHLKKDTCAAFKQDAAFEQEGYAPEGSVEPKTLLNEGGQRMSMRSGCEFVLLSRIDQLQSENDLLRRSLHLMVDRNRILDSRCSCNSRKAAGSQRAREGGSLQQNGKHARGPASSSKSKVGAASHGTARGKRAPSQVEESSSVGRESSSSDTGEEYGELSTGGYIDSRPVGSRSGAGVGKDDIYSASSAEEAAKLGSHGIRWSERKRAKVLMKAAEKWRVDTKRCAWRDCCFEAHEKSLLWRHVVSAHIESQSEYLL